MIPLKLSLRANERITPPRLNSLDSARDPCNVALPWLDRLSCPEYTDQAGPADADAPKLWVNLWLNPILAACEFTFAPEVPAVFRKRYVYSALSVSFRLMLLRHVVPVENVNARCAGRVSMGCNPPTKLERRV